MSLQKTLNIPCVPNFANLIVFPVEKKGESSIHLFSCDSRKPEVPRHYVEVDVLENHVYCLLPSIASSDGFTTRFSKMPDFLTEFPLNLCLGRVGFDGSVVLKERALQSFEKLKMLKHWKGGLCSGCFVSHFPLPNMKKCKFSKQMKSKKNVQVWHYRLRGGADHEEEDIGESSGQFEESVAPMISKAIENAEFHGINLKPGVKNVVSGDCIFESVIDSINLQYCFEESFDGTTDLWRYKWMSETEKIAFKDWNGGLSAEDWKSQFMKLKQSGIYELSLGDLVPPGIAHCTHKNLLIFNTSPQAHSPIYVVDASTFGGSANTEIPVILAYNQVHYEYLVPVTDDDVQKSVDLTKQYLDGQYFLKKHDIPTFLTQEDTDKQKYNENFPVLDNKTNKISVQIKVAQECINDISKRSREGAGITKPSLNDSMSLLDFLPEHLRGKRPRDMSNFEKKEYSNLRRKFLRNNESEKAAMLRKDKDKKAKVNTRENESEEDAKRRKDKDKNAKVNTRENESEEDAKLRKDKARKVNALSRANESDESAKLKKENDKKAKEKCRKVPKSQFSARNAQQVLYGEYIVSELKNSNEKIGSMEHRCKFCDALKWKSEASTLCCKNGKVMLSSFPDPPDYLKDLWTSETVEARTFREHARTFNNALALSSVKVVHRQFSDGFAPTVVFEGKVNQLFGPLQAEDGVVPRFAQLYVLDPATQQNERLKNMHLPKNLTKKQTQVIFNLLKELQELMMDVNPFVKDYIHVCEIPEEEISDGKIVISCKAPDNEHERRYNLQQSFSEVRILTNSEPNDIILRKRGGGLHFIYDLHPAAQPLHFPILFAFGTKGYSEFSRQREGTRRITPREYYAFHLNMRNLDSDFLFRGCRLFQEYICLAFTTIESQRLKFARYNQKALRADSYKNIKEVLKDRVPVIDKIHEDDHNLKVGRRVILPSSFIGSPRWYNSQFQDAMAICREFHKPDFFITMTCNPNWTEIVNELRPGEKVQNRPDIVARVFKQKKDELIKYIKTKQIFGKVPAMLWVIEFQKRGLPHIHLLVILSNDDRVTSASDVDNVICAELPPSPDRFPEGSEKRVQAERLEKIVLQNMIHGPCGKGHEESPCMKDKKCSKKFPKQFCESTVLDPSSMHPEYRRLSPEKGGRSIVVNIKNKEFIIDNRWVVPYSPFLSLKFTCHINIELCTSPTGSKYLYKYAYKGEDRAMVKIEVRKEDTLINEIDDYQDMRSVGSSEAAWHIFNFPIAKKRPAVQALKCHLEDEQQLIFDEGTEEQVIEKQRFTELTAFFDFNADHPNTEIKYVDFPKHFTWDSSNKAWKQRKGAFDTIGRVHSIHPAAGDVFFLRMLLHHDHCKGCTSFERLKTVNGDVLETYQEACRALGLLQDDNEWDDALAEGAVTRMCPALRELFVTILLFCLPSNPRELFNKHWKEWTDDFEKDASNKGLSLKDSQLRTLVLLDIQTRLQSWGRNLTALQIPEPSKQDLMDISFIDKKISPLIQEELEFDQRDMENLLETRKPLLTESQRVVFETTIKALDEGESVLLFIDARGGTGKTFVLNSVLAAVRCLNSNGEISVGLATGTTGIASNLLMLGRTFHSRLKAPLSPHEDSVCSIDARSTLADLIRLARILIVDEAPMLHRYLIEALDRTLRDIMNNDKPFGGKSLILAGDFRQCLPIVAHAGRATIVDASLKRSKLWKQFKKLELKENMRVIASGDPALSDFDEWTLSVGNGTAETLKDTDLIEIPEDICMEIRSNTKEDPKAEDISMKQLADHVYPNLNVNHLIPGWMDGRAILAPTNLQVDSINDMIADSFPGKPVVLTSSDEISNQDDLRRYHIEYLNTLSPTGLPNHRIFLKKGMPLMLMRNLNPKMGLCNGTRLIFDKIHNNHLLECSIVGGQYDTRKVLIPRITLRPKEREFPFEWSRRQFPVRVCFAMTINKSQGQTLQRVGVWLREPCFGHGQLYVALSRVGSPSAIKFAIKKTEDHPFNYTSNVVYKEVFR